MAGTGPQYTSGDVDAFASKAMAPVPKVSNDRSMTDPSMMIALGNLGLATGVRKIMNDTLALSQEVIDVFKDRKSNPTTNLSNPTKTGTKVVANIPVPNPFGNKA